MTPIFLWAVLAAAAAFLITIASPLRFGAKVRYMKPRQPEFEAWASYIHPAIIMYKYSSEDGQPKILIFGRTWRRKKRKGDDVDNSVNTNNVNGSKDVNNANIVNSANNVDGDTGNDAAVKSESGNARINPKRTDDTETSDTVDNIDGMNNANRKKNVNKKKHNPPPSPEASIIARIKKRIDAIKSHWLYRLASDRVFIKKFFNWLLRGAAGIFKFVSFDLFRLRASIGLRDPAALGRLYGYFTAAASALELRGKRGRRGADLAMEPVFTEERVEVDCEMAGSVTPSVVLWHSLAMLFTFPYWRVLRAVRFGRRRGGRSAKPSPSTAG